MSDINYTISYRVAKGFLNAQVNAAGVTAPHRLQPAESSARKLNWMNLCWYPVSRFI